MSRATDWSPLCASDPTPGDPSGVRALGNRYASTARDIERQAANLTRLSTDTGWDSEAGEVFGKHAGELAGKLLDAKDRYEVTGSQLTRWTATLEDVQSRSEALRLEAQAAEAEQLANAPAPFSSMFPPVTPPTPQEAAAETRRGDAYDAASATLTRCRNDLEDVVADRDRAAKQVADSIMDVVDDDLKDSWWERRKHDVSTYKDEIDWVADRLGYIATGLALASMFIPGVNLIVAAAILTAVALAAHSTLAATGNGSWGDVALDAFALATFGAGRVLTSGGRLLGVPVRGAEPAMAALRTAAAPRVAAAVARSVRASTRLQRVALTPRLHNPATAVTARAEHTALKGLATSAAAQQRAAVLGDRLVGFTPLRNLQAADQELGRMLATLQALKPHAGTPAVAALYAEARTAVNLARIPALAGTGVDLLNHGNVFDGVTNAPVFRREVGASW